MSERLHAVMVEWIDAHAVNDFMDKDAIDKAHTPKLVTSVGLRWKHDDSGITILRDYDQDGEADGLLFIPAAMVKRVRTLRF